MSPLKFHLGWNLLLGLLLLVTQVCAGETYTLGRAPQLSPEMTSRDWTPFVEYLAHKSGINIQLKVYAQREDFEQDLKDGKLDFYYGNPAYAVIGKLTHGYIPLVRSNRKPLRGILVSRKDSPYHSLKELKDLTIAFPSESAFAASKFLRASLDEHERFSYTAEFLGHHDEVYRAVLVGKFPAGGGVTRTLERISRPIRDQLRIIYLTPAIAPHPLVVHPGVAKTIRDHVMQNIIDMAKGKKGEKFLKRVKIQEPVRVDYEKDYAPLEPLTRRMYPALIN